MDFKSCPFRKVLDDDFGNFCCAMKHGFSLVSLFEQQVKPVQLVHTNTLH